MTHIHSKDQNINNRFALLTWSCCCFDWKTSKKFLPRLFEASTLKLELDRIERKSYKLTSCIIVHRQLLRKVAAGLKVSHDFPHILLVTAIKLFIVPLLFTLTGSPSSPPMRAAGRRQLIQLFHRRLPCQVPSSYSFPPYLTLFPFPKFMFS